jgi:hypothetical protein
VTAVFEGLELAGKVNVPDTTLLENVRSSIRRGHPQVWPSQLKSDRVCLIGGGPSLEGTFDELRDLYFAGAKIVTVNGAYQWCLDRNIRPNAQIVLDARPTNARFLDPALPLCRYYLCSQCAPETWDAVEGRPFVAIWHDASSDEIVSELDAYFVGKWHGVTGGTTVGTRAIGLLRTIGYLRFDLFGFDSCWMGESHHGYAQPENDRDGRYRLTIAAKDSTVAPRDFWVAPWMIKQLEDLVLLIRASGDSFVLNIHGDGLLAYALHSSADVDWQIDGA